MRRALSVVVALTASLTMLSPAASAAEPVKGGSGWVSTKYLACGISMPDKDQRSYGTLFAADGVNQRSGANTRCTILGRGYLGHRLDYHCWDYGETVNGHRTWTYVRNVTTGRYGWVNDSLLDRNPDGTRGSLVKCT